MRLTVLLLTTLLSFSVSAKKIGVAVGEKAPEINIKSIEGKNFVLSEQVKKGPVVLVFYRGGWCPYCNLQLRQLQAKLLPQVKAHGAQLVAISVDKLDEAAKTSKNKSLGYTVLSDSSAKVIKAYNLVNKVPQELVKKYKNSYKIDLEKSSGQKHHMIAIPAVITVATNGKVVFSYANEDYKVRAQISDIITSLEKLK